MFLDLGLNPIIIVETITRHTNHQCDDYREKGKVGLPEVEMVNGGVNKRERFKEGIEYSVD